MSFDIASFAIGKASGGGGGGGGGETIIEEWDFTSATPLVGKRHGLLMTNPSSQVKFGSNGAEFDESRSSTLYLPTFNIYPIALEADVFSMNMVRAPAYNRRFIMGTTENGLVYRSTGEWSFYSNSWETTSSGETDGSFFDNSTVRVEINTDGKWSIYKNGVFWWSPSVRTLKPSNYNLGMTSDSIVETVISAFRIEWG